MARPSLSNSTPLYHNGVRVSGPADLDPLEAAAAPITTDPHVRRYQRHKQLVAQGMTEDQAIDAMLAEDREARRQPPQPMAQDIRDAVGRGTLYPQEAELVMRDRETEDTAESLGMPRRNSLPQHLHDAAAGNDMVGRFRFVHSPTGLQAVDTSPTPAQQQADFRRWANAEPGSERQATYDPAGFAEYQQQLSDIRHQDYLKEVATYGSAEGPDWRSRLTPEQVAARQERAEREMAAADARRAHREKIKTDPAYADLRARQAERQADLDRRRNNVRLLRQNPFLTLNDPAASDLQKQVIVDAYFRNPRYDTDPRVQVATLESQARERDRKATLDAQAQLAKDERDARAAENKLTREAEDSRWTARDKEQDRQYTERATESRQQFEERMSAMRNAHAAQMKEIDARLTQFGATNALQKSKADEESRLRSQAQLMAFRQQSPGLHDIMTGRPHTRAAADALKSIARNSDRFQYLPGGGFGLREATAMNDELLALAEQARQLGFDTPLTAPEYRRQLIDSFGYSSGWSGGRGGWFGDLFRPMPDGL